MLLIQWIHSTLMSSPLFFFTFVLIVILSPPTQFTITAIALFSLVSTEPVPNMKNPSDTENQLLHKTTPVLKSGVSEKGVAKHCPRYSRANTMLEVKVLKNLTREVHELSLTKSDYFRYIVKFYANIHEKMQYFFSILDN